MELVQKKTKTSISLSFPEQAYRIPHVKNRYSYLSKGFRGGLLRRVDVNTTGVQGLTFVDFDSELHSLK